MVSISCVEILCNDGETARECQLRAREYVFSWPCNMIWRTIFGFPSHFSQGVPDSTWEASDVIGGARMVAHSHSSSSSWSHRDKQRDEIDVVAWLLRHAARYCFLCSHTNTLTRTRINTQRLPGTYVYSQILVRKYTNTSRHVCNEG